MEFEIIHDEQAKLFYTEFEGKIAKLAYRTSGEETILDYYHTFVPMELRGRQIADKIVKFALDYALTHNKKIIPSCPFVKRIIERNPQYLSLIISG